MQELRFLAGTHVQPHADQGRSLGADKDQTVFAKHAHFCALGLIALGGRPTLGVVAQTDSQVVQHGATVKFHLAINVDDGKAARAAFVVALVGRHKAIVIEPCHRIGLTQNARDGFRRIDDAVTLEIDLL